MMEFHKDTIEKLKEEILNELKKGKPMDNTYTCLNLIETIETKEQKINSLQTLNREYVALLEECKKEAVFDYNYTLADKIIAATGKENEITPNNYKLTKQERFALNVLLAGASEDGFKNNETIFRDYHAGTLYQLIMLKLFKPGNFTEKKRKEEINRLTVECKIIGKAVE